MKASLDVGIDVVDALEDTNRVRSRTTRRQLRGRVVLVALIAIALLTVAGYGLWQVTWGQPEQFLAVPAQIGGHKLLEASRGQQALAELRQLHGKDVGLADGWIGYYADNGVAWVGAVASEQPARQLLDAMNLRIGAGNGPFTNLQQVNVDGQTVFTVVGQGQRHYYYQQGKLVIWLAAPKGDEERFLKDALKVIGSDRQ